MKSSMLSARAKPGTELQMERERSEEFLRAFCVVKVLQAESQANSPKVWSWMALHQGPRCEPRQLMCDWVPHSYGWGTQ